MKLRLFMSLMLIIAVVTCFGAGFNYQTVVRNTTGEALATTSATFKINILEDAIDGSVVYAETHTVTTDANGMANMVIGGGDVLSGTLDAMNWDVHTYYLHSEVALNGGAFVDAGTTSLMSVPKAMYAAKAGALHVASPNGTLWKLGINNYGVLIATKVVDDGSGDGSGDDDTFTAPDQLYMIGSLTNWDIANATQFTKDNEYTFTLRYQINKGDIFKFTQERAWGKTDWSAESTNIDEPNALREGGDTPGFGETSGSYLLTVNFKDKTLIITK